MSTVLRFTAMLPAGALMAIVLFLLMHALIDSPPSLGSEGKSLASIRFETIDMEPQEPIVEPPLPEPPKPIEPPPEVEPVAATPFDRNTPPLEMSLPDLYPGGGPSVAGPISGGGGRDDGGLVARVLLQPMYPREAALRGIEGYAVVEFTVTETGVTTDARVVESEPPRVFDRAALAAVLKWRFEPPEKDGQPLRTRVRQRLEFKLEDRG